MKHPFQKIACPQINSPLPLPPSPYPPSEPPISPLLPPPRPSGPEEVGRRPKSSSKNWETSMLVKYFSYLSSIWASTLTAPERKQSQTLWIRDCPSIRPIASKIWPTEINEHILNKWNTLMQQPWEIWERVVSHMGTQRWSGAGRHNNKHCERHLCPRCIVQHPLTTQICSHDNWYGGQTYVVQLIS